MTRVKTFEYKGQMINYLNKVRQNKNIDFWSACYNCQLKAWTLEYKFK
jgi:hypothetical protein